MIENNAQFIFTGEVVGQRPMTQHKQTQQLIAKKSGLEGLLLRPLSARNLPPTIPELKGWVDRDKLKAFYGRTRKPQMTLAQELNVIEYPQPAGGCCFLTDESYAKRMRDMFRHNMDLDSIPRDEVILLKVGRHFRIGDKAKLIVGRNEGENNFLSRYKKGKIALEVRDYGSPIALADANLSEYETMLAASITARYSDCPPGKEAIVQIEKDGTVNELDVVPAVPEDIETMRV